MRLYSPSPHFPLNCACRIFSTRKLTAVKNLSTYYPCMLMAQALTRLLLVWEKDLLPPPPSDDLLKVRLPVSLLQATSRTLSSQNRNGSWGKEGSNSLEETAYAIITLANLASLPFTTSIHAEIHTAIASARKFLSGRWDNDFQGEYLWIEKV